MAQPPAPRGNGVHGARRAHLYRRDRHYLVHEGKVLIVDEATGRVAAGRIWSRGLHQLIELKEACELSPEQVTTAQITFQRFFQRYLRLGGMSGTLAEARDELCSVYNLEVTKVPT
jgi:preprotein translocase subunit SecA